MFTIWWDFKKLRTLTRDYGQVLELTGCVKPVKCAPLKIEPCERDNLVMHWDAFHMLLQLAIGKFPLELGHSLRCWYTEGCWDVEATHTDSQGRIIMPCCEARDSPNLCFFVFLHMFYSFWLFFPSLAASSFGLKEGSKSKNDRLEVRASSNANRLFSVHPPWPPVPCTTKSNISEHGLGTSKVEIEEVESRLVTRILRHPWPTTCPHVFARIHLYLA